MTTAAAPRPPARRKISKVLVAAVAAALLVGVGSGYAAGYRAGDSRSAAAIDAKDAAQTQLARVEKSLDSTQAQYEAIKQKAGDIAAREAAVGARESAVSAQASAAAAAAQQVASSSFGNGVHIVGTNVAAGTYSRGAGSGCYYVWKTGTGSDADIVDNNIVDGPATVTLKDGEVFETSRCGTWSKVG